MKYLFFVLLTCTFAYANPDCDENGNPISSITALATPNCLNEKYLGPAIENRPGELCNSCKTNFQKFVKDPIVELTVKEKQDKFLDAALQEYQKNLIENLFETLKLRGMRPTGSALTKSIQSCQMRSIEDFTKDCNSPKALEYLKKSDTFKKFNESISVELGKVLSQENHYFPEKTLLKRNKPSCFIPEQQLLYISISALEEVLTPEMIKVLSSIDPKKYETVEEMFLDENLINLLGDAANEISDIVSTFKSHPLIADKFRSPASTSLFFKSIKEPKDVAKLRDEIYNKSNGNNFDLRLAKKCDDNYSSLKKAICSADFEQGKIALNPFQNHNKLFAKPLSPSAEEFTTSQSLEIQNLELLRLCDSNAETSKIQLTGLFGELNKNLNTNFVGHTLDSYKVDKHEMDLGKINENLCQRTNQNCNDNTYSCKILQKYKSTKDPKSLDYKLANSANLEVNKLLRSMIGDTSKIDAKTKDILIAQGIIPKDDGTMVKQPDIPERQPDALAKEQGQQQPGGATVTNAKAGTPTNVANSAKGRNPSSESSYQDEGYSNANTKSASNTLPDFSDLMDDQQELRGIQDEIKRRLLGLPQNKPANVNEAKKITRNSFKSRGKKLSPEMEDAFAARMMQQPDTQAQNIANTNSQQPNTNAENRAQVSDGENAQAKWRKGQDQAALMGMKGAQDVLSKDGSNTVAAGESKPKDMTKVALNLADDPRVTLSDMFNKKIDQNDPETQLLKVLLRNKNNFLLQVKSMNFKIIFDEKNNFNLLLESGDRQEAARIRPQLEMFLKKLKT